MLTRLLLLPLLLLLALAGCTAQNALLVSGRFACSMDGKQGYILVVSGAAPAPLALPANADDAAIACARPKAASAP